MSYRVLSIENLNIYIALVHYPVYNKHGEVVTTSVTTLDIHDISRISKTYGIKTYFLVTPLESHRNLVNKMIHHWTEGFGATYNATRKKALHQIDIVRDIDAVKEHIKKECGQGPVVITTCAKKNYSSISFSDLQRKMEAKDHSFLILFGTGWGFTKEVIEQSDYTLEPIAGVTDFNHLPVRAAVAIVLDRLIGNSKKKTAKT